MRKAWWNGGGLRSDSGTDLLTRNVRSKSAFFVVPPFILVPVQASQPWLIGLELGLGPWIGQL